MRSPASTSSYGCGESKGDPDHLTDHEVFYLALGVQRLLTLNDVLRLLRSEVERAGSQRAFARKAGVNVSVVSKTLRRMVLPSEKILSALKLRVAYLSK
jgi:hypothetical protein